MALEEVPVRRPKAQREPLPPECLAISGTCTPAVETGPGRGAYHRISAGSVLPLRARALSGEERLAAGPRDRVWSFFADGGLATGPFAVSR